MNDPPHHRHGRIADRRRLCWAALSIALFALPAAAARIEVDRNGANPTVTVRGTLDDSDGKRFAEVIAGLQKAMVLLNSNGGDLDSGLAIGRAIRQNNFSTGVPDGVQCASACALAWLGGTTRYMATGARIGFHAAYVERRGHPQESGVGNALVGAYLNSLGLPEAAVVYMTSPAPDDIQWLTMADARKLGIAVTLLPPRRGPRGPDRTEPTTGPDRTEPTTGPERTEPITGSGRPMRPDGTESAPSDDPLLQPIKPSHAGPGRESHSELHKKAEHFVAGYFDHWSDLDARALAYVSDLYADEVDYFGQKTDRDAVIEAKQSFVERWPTRVFTVRPQSVEIRCDEDARNCVIKGLVDWECRNSRHGARSSGLSDFVIGARFSSSGEVTVYREGGKVISQSQGQ